MPRLLPTSLVRAGASLTEHQLQQLASCLSSLVAPMGPRSEVHTCAPALASASDPDWADDEAFRPDPNFTPETAAPDLDEGHGYSHNAPSYNHSRPRYQQHKRGMLAPALGRDLVDYQMMITDVAHARRTYLIRDVLEEMQLNGVAPDRQFFESAIRYALLSTRVGDCFYFFEEMKRRGMQPSDRIKGSLVSVLARQGDMDAAMEVWKDVEPTASEDGFELSLAIVNAYGEKGDVAAVRKHLKPFIERYGEVPNALTYGYSALIKAYRKLPFGDRAEYQRQVLAALKEAQDAVAASTAPQKAWALVPAAQFALQKYGCHEAVVELWEGIPEEDRVNPQSWAYTHTITSYIKDATGIFRWPRNEAELRAALKLMWKQVLQEKHEALRAARAAGGEQPDQAAEPEQAITDTLREATAESAPEQATADTLAEAAAPGKPEQGSRRRWVDMSAEESSSDDEDEDEFEDVRLRSDDESSDDEAEAEALRSGWSSNMPLHQALLGPAREALKLAKMPELKWVPREMYSKLRYRYLKGLANHDSWYRAIELHEEMNSKGLELPPSELLEFVEASIQMEVMGCPGALQVGIDLLDRFGQEGLKRNFINATVGSHLLRFAVQRHVNDLTLAHKLWDLLIAQGDIPHRTSCRAYLLAMEQREPGSAQREKVSQIVVNEYGVVTRPKGRARDRAQREDATAAQRAERAQHDGSGTAQRAEHAQHDGSHAA